MERQLINCDVSLSAKNKEEAIKKFKKLWKEVKKINYYLKTDIEDIVFYLDGDGKEGLRKYVEGKVK